MGVTRGDNRQCLNYNQNQLQQTETMVEKQIVGCAELKN